MIAAGCGDDDGETEAAPTATTTTTTTEPETSTTTTTTAPVETTTTTAEAPTDAGACSIFDEDGEPLVADGATDAEALAALGEGWTAERNDAQLVDVQGYLFTCGGETIFYGAWGAGGPEEITDLISWHPSVVDPVGTGPEQLLSDAITAHGGWAIASINVENESREFIQFADGGSPGWSYRIGVPDGGDAGIYPNPTAAFRETDMFRDDAIVTSVWLTLGAPPEAPPEPEPSDEPEQSLEELGYPEVGTINELVIGDLACYASVTPDGGGDDVSVISGFELCLRDDVLGVSSELVYVVASINDCESAEPCGLSRTVWLLDDVVPVG